VTRVARQFAVEPARRHAKPVYVGLFGPSGSGKTYSALRIAKGIGGKVVMIDTENRRGEDYADHFQFEHIDFQPPFGSLDYLDALNTAIKKGAAVVVIDSFSHEHEGQGGLLEAHEAELVRLTRGDESKREALKMLAWTKPKADRRALRAAIARAPVHLVCTFRAKQGAKPVRELDPETNRYKTVVIPTGFAPIAGEEFVYEMTLATLLLPASGGVPTWTSTFMAERTCIKLPRQFEPIVAERGEAPLDEAFGRALASWASGAVVAATPEATPRGATPAAAAPDHEIHREAVTAATHALLHKGGAKTREDAVRLVLEAGVAPARIPRSGPVLQPLSVDELTMVVDYFDRKEQVP